MTCRQINTPTMRIIACDFVHGTGEVKIGNRTWLWDFHDCLGPTFLSVRDGTPLKNQNPPQRVWDAFGEWLDQHKAARAAATVSGEREDSTK